MFLKHVSFPYKTIYMLTSIFNVLEVSFGILNDTLSGIQYDTFAETQKTSISGFKHGYSKLGFILKTATNMLIPKMKSAHSVGATQTKEIR